MKLIPNYKIKYNGVIRRPNILFEAKDEDVEVLIRLFGCRMLESFTPEAHKTTQGENATENRVKGASKRKIQTTVDNYIADVEKANETQNNAEIIDVQKPAKKNRKKKDNE